jgi:murein DD-endopeptidase MepM/ murein hydrolase activator NlpD
MASSFDRNPRRRSVRLSQELRDPWLVPLLIVVGAFLLAAVALARTGTTGQSTARPTQVRTVTTAEPASQPAVSKIVRPTPVFATSGTLRLRLPVSADTVTAIAFHQASTNHAVAMASLVPEVSLSTAARLATQKRSATSTAIPTTAAVTPASTSTSTVSASDIWSGQIIRLWRSGRSGKPDTAVDVGAVAGTPVLAPVDGTVIYVRTYKLYAKYDDFEVHIAPRDASDVEVVLIHISDVCVSPGDRVEAGITRVASVRRLSNLTSLQLAKYTTDGGNHTHVQVNRLPQPGSIWVTLPSGPAIVPFAAFAASSTPTATPAP